MGETTEELRQQIEQTRNGLGDTLDAIGDRVSPGRMVERSKNRMTGGVRSAIDKVMGTAHDTGQTLAGAGHDTTDAMRTHTQGAPLVAGALALAAGFLVAVAFPPSDKEKAITSDLLDKAEPIKAELGHVGQEMAEHLKEPAMNAVDEVKSAAQDGAHTVADAAQHAATDTKGQVHDAVDSVKEQAAGD